MNNVCYDQWANNSIKNEARRIACGNFKSKDSCAAVFLPALEAHDVFLAEQVGTISKQKPLFLLERELSIRRHAKAKLAVNGFNVSSSVESIQEITPNKSVDFAYLDFMGYVDQNIFDWTKNILVPNLAKKFQISFCFAYTFRTTPDFIQQKIKQYECKGLLNETVNNFRLNGDRRQTNLSLYLCMIQEMFSEVGFEFVESNKKPFFYYIGNRNPMLLFTLRNKVKFKMPSTNSKTTNSVGSYASKASKLIQTFPAEVAANSKEMTSWRRSLTSYCNSREKETGREARYYRAAIKAVIAKNGHDNSMI